jgi:hypothetical protein
MADTRSFRRIPLRQLLNEFRIRRHILEQGAMGLEREIGQHHPGTFREPCDTVPVVRWMDAQPGQKD